MKKRNWKSYLMLLVSGIATTLAIQQLVKACAGYELIWRDNPQVFMQPNIDEGKKRFELFYYSTEFLNGGKEDTVSFNEQDVIESDQNTDNWYQFFQKRIPKHLLYKFIYTSPTYVYQEPLQPDHFSNFFAKDTFIQLIRKNREALTYFMIAKANEFTSDEQDNGWNEFSTWDVYGDEHLSKQRKHPSIANQIIRQLNICKNPHYRLRYAFQLIRNYRYTYQSDRVDSLYQLYFSQQPASDLKLAALNYATDALVNNKQQVKANYYASLLFDASEDKQLRAYHNLDPRIPIEDVLPYCKDDKQQAMVYALYAFKDFWGYAEYVKKAVELDQNNQSINDLLVREINKIDHKLMPELSGLFGISDYYEPAEEQSLLDTAGNIIKVYPSIESNTRLLIDLIQSLKTKQTQYQNFYNLSLAHLYIITKEYQNASILLQKLHHQKLNTKLALQLQLSSLILHIKSNNLREYTNQQKLAEYINYIDAHQNDWYYNEFIPNGIRLIAVEKLLKDGDFARAYLLSESVTLIYESSLFMKDHVRAEDIDTIIAIRTKQNNLFDQLISRKPQLNSNELYDIQGAKYMQQNNLIAANESFKKANSVYIPINFSNLNTNPDGHPCYPYMYEPISKNEEHYYTPEEVMRHNERAKKLTWKTNHYSVTQTMLNLKKLIKEGKGNLAEHYFNLASLYTEISYFGRAYHTLQYDKSWSWYELEYLDRKPEWAEHYYGTAWAIPYYQQALKLSKNKELTAKCLYALFRCNRHLKRFNNNEKSTVDLKYLYLLNDSYNNTAYYQIKECWGLSAYVNELRNPLTQPNK